MWGRGEQLCFSDSPLKTGARSPVLRALGSTALHVHPETPAARRGVWHSLGFCIPAGTGLETLGDPASLPGTSLAFEFDVWETTLGTPCEAAACPGH